MYTRFDSLLHESITVIIIPLLQYMTNSVSCKFKVMFFGVFHFLPSINIILVSIVILN